MIDRYVFIKLADPHATQAGRAEVAREAGKLTGIPGVREVRAGAPADAHAEAAWDVSLCVSFASLEDAESYRAHPVHRAFVDEFLAPRLVVIKAWNMAVDRAR